MRALGTMAGLLLAACGPAEVPPEPCVHGVPTLEIIEEDRPAPSPGVSTPLTILVTPTCGAVPQPVTVSLEGDGEFTLVSAPDTLLGPTEATVSFRAFDAERKEATLVVDTEEDRTWLVLAMAVTPDADGDGSRGPHADGPDCDDGDPSRFPGADEVDNGVDDDCDGRIDEDFVPPDSVVITEIAARPSGGWEASTWIEVWNAGEREVDLAGWTLQVGPARIPVRRSTVVEPGGHVVLGFDPLAEVAAGVSVEVVLGGRLPPDWDGLAVIADDTVWAGSGASSDLAPVGRTLSLDPAREPTAADQAEAWCVGTSRLASGERGTPGAPNDPCVLARDLDEDGDGWTPRDGDCDDARDDRFPGADERWNHADDDCDGRVDRGVVGRDLGLSYGSGPVVLDLDDDGVFEVYQSTRAALWDASDLPVAGTTERVTIGDLYGMDAARIERASSGDLLLAHPRSGGELWLFDEALLAVGGTASEEDARAHITSGSSGGQVAADVDGDGADEWVRGGVDRLSLDEVTERTGTLTFEDLSSPSWSTSSYVTALGAGDTDGDGYDDVLLSLGMGDLRLVRGGVEPDLDPTDPSLQLASESTLFAARTLEDLDGDGAADMVLMEIPTGGAWVLPVDGTGTIELADAVATLDRGSHRWDGGSLVDIEQDGHADLVVKDDTVGDVRVLSGPFSGDVQVDDVLTLTVQPGEAYVVSGWAEGVDADSDGDMDLIVSSLFLENRAP